MWMDSYAHLYTLVIHGFYLRASLHAAASSGSAKKRGSGAYSGPQTSVFYRISDMSDKNVLENAVSFTS